MEIKLTETEQDSFDLTEESLFDCLVDGVKDGWLEWADCDKTDEKIDPDQENAGKHGV